MHEITHFVAHEVYNNGCNPYHGDDEVNRECFNQIRETLKNLPNREDTLPALINEAFLYYPENLQNAELIVRVAQIIASIEGGYALLQNQCRDLLAYYEKTFLQDCVQHFEKLSNRHCICRELPIHNNAFFEAQPLNNPNRFLLFQNLQRQEEREQALQFFQEREDVQFQRRMGQ